MSHPLRGELDHAVLQCSDVEASLRFFRDLLGFAAERVEAWREGTALFPMVRISEASVIDLLPAGEAAASADAPDEGQRLNHLALAVDAEAYERLLRRLPEAGVAIEAGPMPLSGARGMGTGFYVKAPDGVRVEIRTYGR